MDHGQADPSFAALGGLLVILAQASETHQPGKGSFHDPALGQDVKTFEFVAAFDDLQAPAGQSAHPGDELSRVTAISPNELQPAKAVKHKPLENQLRSVAILQACAVDDHRQKQAQCIHDQVALAALDLLARIVAAA